VKKNVLALLVAAALPFVCAKQAQAAAFALAEQGVSGLGNAYAGAAAAAEDASTVWWNPAGMSRLPRGKHLLLGGHAIVPSTEFSDKGSQIAAFSNPALNGNGGDSGSAAFVPNVFFAMDFNPAWSFGIGVNVPFGLKTEYDSNWIGRFQGIESEVKTININPAVSYKVSDRMSVGFGISYQTGEVNLLTGANYSAAAFAAGFAAGGAPGGAAALAAVGGPGVEGQNKTNIDGDAWGFNVGVLFDITPATRMGIHYRSSVDYELEGSTSFSNVPAAIAANPLVSNSNVKLDLKTPANLSFSAVHRLNNQWELLADVTWTEWSKISQLPLVRTSGPASGATLDTLTFNFDDTWRVAIGANYKMGGPWTFRGGVAYDQSPVPNAETRSVRLPDNDRYWLSLGATYQMSKAGRFDFGYSFVQVKDADINNNQAAAGRGVVTGTYEATVNIFSVSYQHSF
jgi:long-chain fatty acid transport protein